MLSKLRVGIICGGYSAEHEVSLRSAIFIEQFIDKSRFETLVLWIDKEGNWYIVKTFDYSGCIDFNQAKHIPILLRQNFNRFKFFWNDLLKLDVIFPIVHGTLGEDGSLQGFLSMMNVPYVGSDVLGSAICMYKDITRHVLRSAGLPVVPFKTFLLKERTKIDFHNLIKIFGLPLFIKPVNQGSSIGVSKVTNLQAFYTALDIAFSYSYKIIIEPCINGRELECAVLDGDPPESSVCGEIVLKKNHFYTYNDKYIQNSSQIVIPAVLDYSISTAIRHFAIQAFQILYCFGMARVDVFLTANNQILINEVNTLPGFTDVSMYPKLWEATGLKIEILITKLIELALDRYYKHNNFDRTDSINTVVF